MFKIFISLLLIGLTCRSQELVELKIGDTVPDVELNDILKYGKAKVKLSDFDGKIIILDFWSRACAPCIAGMPKMDSLQKLFKDDIIILPVYPLYKIEKSNVNAIKKFWETNFYTKSTKLPIVLDTTFRKLFGFQVAFQVWIDKNRILRAKTTEEYVNEKEIRKFISGIFPSWAIATKSFYDLHQSLFKNITLNDFDSVTKHKSFYSFSTRYLPEVESAIQYFRDSVSGTTRVSGINLGILSYYFEILKYNKIFGPRFIIESRKKEKFFAEGYFNEWLKNYGFCYEKVAPLRGTSESFYESMRIDFNNIFEVYGRFEYRIVECWVIKKGKRNRILLKFDEKNLNQGKELVLESITELLEMYYNQDYRRSFSQFVFLDESGGDNSLKIRLPISFSITDFEVLKSELNRHSYDLVREKRRIKMFVISDIPPS